MVFNNVNYKAKNLIPIPLGLANNYSPKNIRFLDLRNNKSREKKDKQDCILTQIQMIKKDKTYFISKIKYFLLINHHVNKRIYKQNRRTQVCFSSVGNGLILIEFGSFVSWLNPIIKRHITYQYLDENSILFIDEYEDINKPIIENFEKRYSELNKEILNIQFWIMKIQNKVISNEKSTLLNRSL